jgi:tripartite-type tricarboxylate transporter receptor subunit TctC
LFPGVIPVLPVDRSALAGIRNPSQKRRIDSVRDASAILRLTAGAAALPALSRIARAQAYPTKPVRFIVGFAAGGGGDVLARLIGQWLSERLGQQFIIENRTGAGGNIGAEAVVRAPPDGYTLHRRGVSLESVPRPFYLKSARLARVRPTLRA